MAKRIHGCQAGICFIVLTLGIFISRLNAWMTLPEKTFRKGAAVQPLHHFPSGRKRRAGLPQTTQAAWTGSLLTLRLELWSYCACGAEGRGEAG
jgi:hypothetical protein